MFNDSKEMRMQQFGRNSQIETSSISISFPLAKNLDVQTA